MNKEILKYCFEKGVLLDNEILGLFSGTNDLESVKLIIEKIKSLSHQKIITKNVLDSNKEGVMGLFSDLPSENQESLEKLKIKLGLSIEISKEVRNVAREPGKIKSSFDEQGSVKILSSTSVSNKKLEVKDFVNYFRGRFSEMKGFLQEHSNLENLVSINKISGSRHNVSVIGIVSERRVTKNKNLILDIEDLTGKIRILFNKDKKELYEKAEEVALDSVIGVRGSGSREIIFANDVMLPEARLPERKISRLDENVLFIGDLHFGSKRFLEKGFSKFVDYLSEDNLDSEARKVKYLFIIGDLVTGVGVYPNQENDLVIEDIEEQFLKISELIKRIRKDIKIIISPGNHDGVRLMEPQPIFDEKFAWPLYEMENVILTENPALINIGEGEGFSGFNVLTYHGFSLPFYANKVARLLVSRAMNTPDEIVKYLLMNRHLAPTHSSVQYFPFEKDPLIIREIPDVMVVGHSHKSAISYYNNILIVSISCWEGMTPYQEKFGNIPDHCKVPMFNLKTRAVKILDFESDD